MDAVLEWRREFGDLLGKPKEAALERYGAVKCPPREITSLKVVGKNFRMRAILDFDVLAPAESLVHIFHFSV